MSLRAQEKLNDHVKTCQQCQQARGMQECCQTGRVLARIIESKATR
jgi:sulfur relay (sulfurtransferase) complex TusBCD TusD component (DsrE family)